MTNLFVYGAMKRGEPLHWHLKKADFVGTGVVSGYALYRFSSCAGLVRGNLGEVAGEVYRVSASTLDSLDMVEGVFQGLYERDTVFVHLDDYPDEEPINAVSYIYISKVPDSAELIRSGIWTCSIKPVSTSHSL